MASMFSKAAPTPALPAVPPSDDSEARAAELEAARKKEVIAQAAMGRGSTTKAGAAIALMKQQEKATDTVGATNALGLSTG